MLATRHVVSCHAKRSETYLPLYLSTMSYCIDVSLLVFAPHDLERSVSTVKMIISERYRSTYVP